MYPHLNSGVRLLLELYRVVVIKHVGFFTIWVKLTMPFTCTSLPLNLYTSVFGGACGFGFEQKFWRINEFGKRGHGSADLHIPIHPTPGDDQLFEYDDDSDNDSDGFIVEKDGAIRDMQSEELSFLLASRRTQSGRKVTTRKVLLWT